MRIIRAAVPQRSLVLARPRIRRPSGLPQSWSFSSTANHLTKQMPPRPKVTESEFEEVFLKGSGPGGQKINKTNSAVQLRHIPTGIVVKYQNTRSREQNRKMARQLLAQKLDEMQHGEEARSKVVERVKSKKKASAAKKSRRKYRALEEEKGAAPEAANGGHDPSEGDTATSVESSAVAQHDNASVLSRLRAAREHSHSSAPTVDEKD